MVAHISIVTIEWAIKGEIKMFSDLVFGDLLMAWNFREPSGKRLPIFNLWVVQRLCKIIGTPVVNKTTSSSKWRKPGEHGNKWSLKTMCCARGYSLCSKSQCYQLLCPTVPTPGMCCNIPSHYPVEAGVLQASWRSTEPWNQADLGGSVCARVCMYMHARVSFVGVVGSDGWEQAESR